MEITTRELLGGWEFVIRQRYELLGALKNSDLDFTPQGSPKFKDLQYQFACIALTQKSYTEMLRLGKKFDRRFFVKFRSEFTKVRTVNKLRSLLETTDSEFRREMTRLSGEELFDWGDIKTPVWRIITFLQEHERLHHGQLISYFTLAEIDPPKDFKKLWNL